MVNRILVAVPKGYKFVEFEFAFPVLPSLIKATPIKDLSNNSGIYLMEMDTPPPNNSI